MKKAAKHADRQTDHERLETNRRLAETKLLALRQQMNPHFIFNSLTSINSFILQNEGERASDLLTKFSRLMRQVLENSQTDWVSLRKELNTLQIYLELEQLRCDKKMDVQVEVGEDIDVDTVHVPPLLTQPYVDNAIWQGLLPMKEGTPRLRIQYRRVDEQLLIQIQDNGISRVTSARQRAEPLRRYQGEGMTLLAERLQLLNEMYDVHAQVTLVDQYGADGLPVGISVDFTLKLR